MIALWLTLAALTAAALAAIARPLLKRSAPAQERNAFDRAVYADQLAELDRDAARGLIAPSEAEAARNEISRRLLAAEASFEPMHRGDKRIPIAALALVPFVAIGLYLSVGRPNLPDVPRAERMAKASASQDVPALIAQVEDHLAQHPEDAQGWSVLAPAYRKMERFEDAAAAYGNLIRLSPPSADLFADYAEMLVFANGGLVPGDAAKALVQALAANPQHPKSLYYSGLALKQEGKLGQAVAIWHRLLALSPPDAPWRNQLEMDIAAAQSPGPTQDQVAAAESMNVEDRQAMIRGMVDGLEAKLKQDGSDIEGWHRLIRARMVLGEPAKASEAYAAARSQFKDKPDVLASFEGLAKELGVK